MTSLICMYQVNSNCGTKQTGQSSGQAIHYSWTSSNSAILQINGSSTNSSVNVYGAGFGTANMSGNATATYFGPPATCTFGGGGPTPVNVSATLTLSTATFITQVANGTATFNAVVTIGAASSNQLPVTFTITMSAPSNPNGVVLTQGGSSAQKTCQITTSAGNCSVQFPVQSDVNNTHAGAVTWQFSASTGNTDYGSPAGTATTNPNPLVGTVNFTN
jgi:hypothetical protein